MYDRDWLQRRAAQVAPHEACGFVLSCGEILEIRNVAPNPCKGFEMDKRHAFEKLLGRDIAAIWHTHPSGLAYPSAADIRAMTTGAIRPEWLYLIVTSSQVTEWNPGNYAPKEDTFWEAFAV